MRCPTLAARLPPVRSAAIALLGLALLLPASAAAPRPSVPPCALGSSAADLRGFEARALARAESAYGSAAARRAFSTGVAAYVYGLAPLSVRNTVPRFPLNQILSIGELVEPDVRTVVSPNVDTTYTVGQINLSAGPRVVDVPDTRGRYYVLQFMDAYSNTFAYVGRRTTGTRPGSYVLVPPGYGGPLPARVPRLRSPTNLIWLIGRTLVKSPAEPRSGHHAHGRLPPHPPGRLERGHAQPRARDSHLPAPAEQAGAAQGAGLPRPARADAGGEPPARGRRLCPSGVPRRGHRRGPHPLDRGHRRGEEGPGRRGTAGATARHAGGGPRERVQPGPQQRLGRAQVLHRQLRAQLPGPGRDRPLRPGREHRSRRPSTCPPSRTAAGARSAGATAIACASAAASCRPRTPSGRSRCTTRPGTCIPTRPIATPSATARRACAGAATARSRSPSPTPGRRAPPRRTGCPAPAGRFRVLLRIYEPRRPALNGRSEAACRAAPLAGHVRGGAGGPGRDERVQRT